MSEPQKRRSLGSLIKFAASSLLGFCVDYGMYSLLVSLTAGMGSSSVPVSNVLARIVSATVNYTVNRRFVFKSDKNYFRAGFQYFLLAACILTGNTFLLNFLVNGIGWNKFAAKLLTEITFFSLSWLVQKFLIFRKNKTGEQDGPSCPDTEADGSAVAGQDLNRR